MYVTLNVPFADRKVRLHYTQSETVDSIEELQHELAREALRLHDIRNGVEIASLADLPAGTGLGSSSCYLVGLLAAIRAYLGLSLTKEELADEACRIELDVLGKPIGKQDQYMAAAGGLTELHIDRDGTVRIERIELPGYAITELISKTHLLLYERPPQHDGHLGRTDDGSRSWHGRRRDESARDPRDRPRDRCGDQGAAGSTSSGA